MRITNLNPDSDIGATSWWVEFEGHRLLLDAGTHPKREGRASLPRYDLVDGQELDALVLTHCHHDHVGSLPVALHHFPRAHVLMTELSYHLVERVLHNSVNVMQRQRDELGIREYPLYTHQEVDDFAAVFQGFQYSREIEWAQFPRRRAGSRLPTLEFLDAGHALGSAGVMIRGERQTLFFTGDVCFHDQTLLRRADFDGVRADVLVMETTRGNKATPAGFTREAEIERLTTDLEAVLARRGSVLIPAFALGRTQEILAMLALLMQTGRLKPQPVYIGGLGRVFTEIYDLESHRMNRNHTNLKLTHALNLQVLSSNDSQAVRLSPGRIFVLTSGMMVEKTAAHDLALRLFADEKHAIFFVGYTDPSTPGGRLRASRRGEKFLFSGSSGEVARNCAVHEFDLTAHAFREDLLEFVGQVRPRTVVLGHGDAPAREWFAAAIHHRFPKISIHQPGPGETVMAD